MRPRPALPAPTPTPRRTALSRAAFVSAALALAVVAPARADTPTAPAETASAAAPSVPATVPARARPRLGLVLSGGGARGLAHIGVLKVLEREHIPVDVVAGTSMGAIVGGLYASGIPADELARVVLRIDWSEMFATRIDRRQLSERRKEEDYEFSPVVELGLRDGELRAPQATLSSRGLEILLRREIRGEREQADFAALPTPFAAVASDMETGAEIVLHQGDLALAMRSSMSVPGVFAPTEVPYGNQTRILGDGGLVDNLPVDVARSLGAEELVAVNVGTPLAGREALNSLVGVTAQMIGILTEQNVHRSIASLGPHDYLLTPELGSLSNTDFARCAELIAAGERAAEAALPQLRRWAVDDAQWQAWLARRQRKPPGPLPKIAALAFEGSTQTNPKAVEQRLESQAGETFDPERAERDVRELASSGDYERVDYRLEPLPGRDDKTLVFEMADKSWGPNYLRVGLDLSTDFSGHSAFDLRLSHNRHWLTDSGTEWRNQLSIGATPRLYSELYQPLTFKIGGMSDWFASGWGAVEHRNLTLYDHDSGVEQARLGRGEFSMGLDLGQALGALGEWRLGLVHEVWRITPELVGSNADLSPAQFNQTWHETGLRAKLALDQLDYANFPQHGWRLVTSYTDGVTSGPGEPRTWFQRAEGELTAVQSFGAHTLNLHLSGLVAAQPVDSTQGPYALGGFQQLSGYQPGQLTGNALLFGRLGYYYRLDTAPVFTRGFFVGGTLEAGNAWAHAHEVTLSGLRTAGSVFLGADTGLGPLYLALGHAPLGGTAIYLFIGRP
ncbi:MAG: patatin-like phospholipase family protein [Pelomonas sp.]|nr:patatin-like phospholipase family protein [Roseateles sp.]